MDWLLEIFRNDWMPHGHCIRWTPWLLWGRVAADTLIALSYYVIPGLMVVFARRYGVSVSLVSSWKALSLIYFFAAFILLCGITHAMDAYTMWVPIYGIDVVIRILCAIASVGTVVLVWVYGHTQAEDDWSDLSIKRRTLEVAERLANHAEILCRDAR